MTVDIEPKSLPPWVWPDLKRERERDVRLSQSRVPTVTDSCCSCDHPWELLSHPFEIEHSSIDNIDIDNIDIDNIDNKGINVVG
jgi:hypothetical protein